MKYILSILIAIFLFGCSAPPKRVKPVITQDKVVRVDQKALEACALLSENVLIVTFEDMLRVYSDVATAYGVCAEKQNSSIKLIKEFGNIK